MNTYRTPIHRAHSFGRFQHRHRYGRGCDAAHDGHGVRRLLTLVRRIVEAIPFRISAYGATILAGTVFAGCSGAPLSVDEWPGSNQHLTISRIDDTTLHLIGEIRRGDFARFEKAFTPQIKTMVVDSGGGETYDALRMARRMAQRDMTVIVRGICISSCANYLFTAADTRVIDGGVVGFHGNVAAALEENGGIDGMLSDARWQLQHMTPTPPPEVIEKTLRTTRTETLEQIPWEKELLDQFGIAQQLFDKTQREAQAGRYSVLAPSAATFRRYGYIGIRGEQDREIIARLSATGRLILYE